MKKETSRQSGAASCGTCTYYIYDDEYEENMSATSAWMKTNISA